MKENMENFEQEYNNLRAAVAAVYYSAHWSADRDIDESALWERLRNIAGFEKGAFSHMKSEFEWNYTDLKQCVIYTISGYDNYHITRGAENDYVVYHMGCAGDSYTELRYAKEEIERQIKETNKRKFEWISGKHDNGIHHQIKNDNVYAIVCYSGKTGATTFYKGHYDNDFYSLEEAKEYVESEQ